MAARNGIRIYPEPMSAPALGLTDRQGRRHRLEDYRGRIVVVNFWASWCAPCRNEMPSLRATKRAFDERGIVVLAVSLDEAWDTATKGLAGYETDFVALLDLGGDMAGRWGVIGIPTAFVLDEQGWIRSKIVGGHDWQAPALLQHFEDIFNAVNADASRHSTSFTVLERPAPAESPPVIPTGQ